MLVLESHAVRAWEFSPFLDLSETYSDNIEPLSGDEKKEEFVRQISPGFSLNNKTRRLDLSLQYQWQGLYYTNDSERDSSYQQLQSSVNATLLNDLLFLDGQQAYRQIITNPQAQGVQGNISIATDRQDVSTTKVSPYMKKRLGSFADMALRYSYDEVRYSEDSGQNSLGNNWSFDMRGINRGGRWSWSLRYANQTVDYEEQSKADETTENASISLAYVLSSNVSFNGVAGYEKNEYEKSLQAEKPESEYWSLGLDWMPSPRTQIGLSGGERYFGRNWQFILSQRGRRSAIKASYTKSLVSQRQYVAEQAFDLVTLEPVTLFFPYDEVYVSSKGDIAAEYYSRKSTVSVSWSKERREYQVSLLGQDVVSRKLAWSWQASRLTSLSFDVLSTINKTEGQPSVKTVTYAMASSSQLGKRANVSFDVRRTTYDSMPVIKYSENQATIRLGLKF